MFNFLTNIVDIVRGKERADWVVSNWLRSHADDYASFVVGIESMAEGNMTAAYNIYNVMKECMPPEAEQYYDILLQTFTGKPDAFDEICRLKYANEIGECAINGKTLEINIGTGEITLTSTPKKGRLIVKAEDIMTEWDALPLYTKAYCKDRFEEYKASLPVAMRPTALKMVTDLIKIHYVANLVFMPGIMANLYDKTIRENDDTLFAMYYFVTFDQGLQRMARIFSTIVNNEIPGVNGVSVFKSTIHYLAMTSINSGWAPKESWKDVAENCDNDEAWKEIMHAIRYAKTKHGKPLKQMTIDEMLRCKDKITMRALMLKFLDEHRGLFGPAYLRWCLDSAGCIKDVPYMAYHRALELLLGKQMDSKKPQERYGLLKNRQDKCKRNPRIWKEVNLIEEKWVHLFRKTL